MTDHETLAVYDAKATEYDTIFCVSNEADPQLQHFMSLLPEGGAVLDLGCGPGRSAMKMAARGFAVTATDASAEMVKLAATRPGVTARQESFEDMRGTAIYDGVFANFSLLHASRDDLPGYIAMIAQMLRPGGAFHMGMKTGSGTKRDKIGRRYTYVTLAEMQALARDAGLTPLADWQGEDPGLDGTIAPWAVIQARKDG